MKIQTAPLHAGLLLTAFVFCLSARAQPQLGIDLQQQEPRLIWNSLSGGVYHVLSRPSLNSGAWERAATVVSEGASANWVDSSHGNATRFYWLVQGDAALSAQVSVVHASTAPPLLLSTLTNGSYAEARSLIQTLAPLGQFRLPLPLPDLDPFADVIVRDVQIYFDDDNRSITFWGRATLLNQPVELLATGYWGTEPGALPTFALGIKLSELTISMLSQAFAGSALAGLDFKNTVIILAQGSGTLDPLKFPGKAFGFYEGAEIDVERGVNIFKEIDLSPLPVLKGLRLLGIPETSLALQGIVSVDPNIFFGGAPGLDPALFHIHSFLNNAPLRGQPKWISTTSRRLDLAMLGLVAPPAAGFQGLAQSPPPPPQLMVSLTDQLKIQIEDDELEFETVTDLSTLDTNATTTLTGTSHRPWEKPLGIDWIVLSNLTVELNLEGGEVQDAEISATFFVNGKEGKATIDVPDAEDAAAEISLSTEEFTRAEIASFLQAHAGLTISENDLPQDLVVKEPKLVLKTQPNAKFTLTGKVPVLGSLEAEILVTIVERDGQPHVLVSINADDLKLSHLIPATAGTFLGEIALPIGGFTSGAQEQTIPAEELDPPARGFFQRIHEQSNFSVSVKTGVALDAVLPLSAFPAPALQAVGLNAADRVILKGLANVTLGILTKSGPLNLDRLRLEADLPPSPPPGLPAALQPATVLSRRLVLTYEGAALDLALESNVIVTIDGKPVTLAFRASLANPTQAGSVQLVGTMTSAWSRPFGIDWLTLEQVQLRLAASGGGGEGVLTGRLLIGGKSVETSIELVSVGGQPSAKLRATLDQLSLTELISWAQDRFGVSPFGDQPPGGLLDLRQLTFEIQSGPVPQFTVSANATVLNGLPTKVLFTMVRQNGQNEPVLSLGLDNFGLSSLSSRFAGTTAGDLKFPSTAYTFSRRPLSMPSSDLSGEARAFFQKIYGQSDFTFKTEAGVSFGAQLPLSLLPAQAVSILGMNPADRAVLEGTIGISFGMLSGSAAVELAQLDLHVALPNARPVKLPSWMAADPTVQRTLAFSYRNLPGPENVLAIRITDRITVTIDNARRNFVLSTALSSAGELVFEGTMIGPWTKPFGVDWLTLEQVGLAFSTDGVRSEGSLRSSIPVGSKRVDLAIEITSSTDGTSSQPSAKFRATLDQLSLTELISWAQDRFGVSPFGDQPPGGLLDLRQLTFEIQSAPAPQFTVSANATVLNGLPTKVLFTIVRKDGQNEPVLSLGLDNFGLSSLSSRFAETTAGDMKFPSTAYTFSRKPLSMPSSDLSGEARAFFQKIYGQSDFTFKTEAGVSFGAQLPLSLLSAQAVSILGMNPADKVTLEGTVGISFGMLSGSASLDLTQLDLKVALPNARPAKLPSWMAVDPTVQRTLAFSYRNLPGPENALAIRITDRITVTIDNARRTFVLSTAVSSAGELVFDGTMIGSWAQPFGVEWLTLDQVSLGFRTDGTQSEGALRSSFPLGSKQIDLGIEITSAGNGPSVELTGTVNQLSIDDVIELARRQIDRPLFPGSPPADFATLNNATITIRLGAVKSFSIGATAQLAGRQTELLWSIESAAGQEPHILLGMQPTGWTLGGAFPGLSNPIVDGLNFPTPTLVFANFERKKEPTQVQEEEKRFYGKVFGAGDFALKVPSGLGLLGGLPLDALPADGALRQLLNVLGMETDKLILEGSLGNSLSLITGGGGGGADALKDVSLHIALPPMRPKGSPAWFKSGQLSLEITGAPSFGVAGEVTVEVEGDILTFFIESGISFPGPSLQLVGGLKAAGGWTSPLGVEWLTLNELIVLIGVDATGSAKLGFSGDMIIGQKDLHVAALVAVNATGVPTNLILEGSSVEGFALSDIAALQAKMAAVTFPGAPQIPIDRLPEMAMKNIALKFAPRPEPSLGIERGLAFSGDFYMQMQRGGALERVASARFKVGEGEISAVGEMSSGGVGPIAWKDPYLDLMLSRETQHLFVGGYASSQFLTGDLDLALSKEEMGFTMAARILNQFDVQFNGQSEFNFVTPTFPVNGNMLGDFLANATSDAKSRFGEVSAQGKAAIANAQGLVNDALSLKNLKDLEIGAKIQTLLEDLDLAKRTMDAAKAVRDSALSALNSARVTRDAAWTLYVNTPTWQPVLKAAYYTEYLAKAAVYQTRNVAYQAANSSYLLAKAAYEIIPPIEQNPIIIALRSELNELASRLELRRQQLSAVAQTFGSVIDAVQKGLITIEGASINTTLRDLIDTHRTSMTITLVFGGERRKFTPTWDFDRTVRENLKPVVDQVLREQGIF